MIKFKPYLILLWLSILITPSKGQTAFSYTASLITNANDYIEKTTATLTVLHVNNVQKIHYQDGESNEILVFSCDSILGSFEKGKFSLCGKGLKEDYFKSSLGKLQMRPGNVNIKYSGSRELISGFVCAEIIVSYTYRIPGIELPFRSHLWVSNDLKFKGDLNMNDFNEVWIPEGLSDSLKKTEALVFKQEIYFNDEKVGTAMITDFKNLDYVNEPYAIAKSVCKKTIRIANYKRQVNQQRRAKESFNRLSGSN